MQGSTPYATVSIRDHDEGAHDAAVLAASGTYDAQDADVYDYGLDSDDGVALTADRGVGVGGYRDATPSQHGGAGGVVRQPEVVHGEAGLQRPMPVIEQEHQLLKDKFFLALFAGQLGVVSLMGLVAGARNSRTSWLANQSAREETRGLWLVTATTGVVLGAALLTISISPQFQELLVVHCQRIAACLLTAVALLLLSGGKLFLGLLIVVLVVADFVWFLRAHDRVQFVKVLLRVAGVALKEHPRLATVVVVALFVQLAYSQLWGMILVHVLRAGAGRVGDAAFLGVMLFSYRWTTTVIKGILRVTISGAVTESLCTMPIGDGGTTLVDAQVASSMPLTSALATLEDEEEEDAAIADDFGADSGGGAGAGPRSGRNVTETSSRATRRSNAAVNMYLKSACITSLGSICAGALVGVVTPILWAVLRALRALEHSRFRSCCVPMAGVVEGVLIMSHKYAYPDVAVHEKPWFQAARESWAAFNARGLEAVVADDASDRVLLFCCYIVGALHAFFGYFILGIGVHAWPLVLFVSFWFGFSSTSLALTPVETVVTSLFVSFANFPESLSQRHPIIYHRLCRISEVRHFQRSAADNGL